ncbi:hypothetical protein IAT40_000127 [Kwoniella sp. CBS 6097]
MSIKAPKPRQIKLPFTVPRPSKSDAKSQGIKPCGICRKRDSRYTCPRCNVLYCSLDCFRDESHAQCSEPFYKSTVMSSIASDPSAGLSDKKDMLDMLRRFEEAQAGLDLHGNGGDGGGGSSVQGEGGAGGVDDLLEQLRKLEEDEGADEELAEKLKDVDLDNIDSNALFHLLPQTHRDAFLEALRNPDSETTKALLEDAVARDSDQGLGDDLGGHGIPDVLPWWEGDELDDQVNDHDENEEEEAEARIGGMGLASATMPELIPAELLEGIHPPVGVGKKLIYNAIAICITYVHTLLSFRLSSLDSKYIANTEHDHAHNEEGQDDLSAVTFAEIRSFIGRLVPFLVEPRSTVRHESLGVAWGSVWEIIGADQGTPPSTMTLGTLLSILPKLLHPPIIADSKPKLFNLLSDLYNLFSPTAPSPTNATTTASSPAAIAATKKGGGAAALAVQKKLAFYFRALEALDRREWLALQKEVEKELEKLREESGDVGADAQGNGDGDINRIGAMGKVSPVRREKLEIL